MPRIEDRQAFQEMIAEAGRADRRFDAGLDLSPGTFVGIEDNALVYAGHTVWNRHNEKLKGSYRGGIKVRPRDQWVVHQNTHEAMISDVQAEMILAQRSLKSASQRRGRQSPYLLAGLLRCAYGANYDGDAGYYKCHRRKDGCDSRSIKQGTIEQAVLGVLFEQYLTVETLASIREQLVKLEATTGARHKRDIEGLRAQLKDITRQTDTLIALLTEIEHRRPLLTKIDELEAQRVVLAARLQVTAPLRGQRPQAVGRPFSALLRGTLSQGNRVWRSGIEEIDCPNTGRVGIPGRGRPDPRPKLPRSYRG
jgi:hypothetical protein